MSMCKLFSYIVNFIFFFILNVHANGAQLQNNYDNQILSSIYSEYNNDYLTWKTLPRYDKFIEKKSSLLNQIIIEEYENINKIKSEQNFTLDLLKSLDQIKKKISSTRSMNCKIPMLTIGTPKHQKPIAACTVF